MTDYIYFPKSKAWLITEITPLILYSLVFIFLSFILYKVNKTREKSSRCIINLMIACLLLAVMCKFSLPLIYISLFLGALTVKSLGIWDYFKEKLSIREWLIYISLFSILNLEFRFLFLELAVMLNITKWIYFYLVILTHRKIRYDEIYAEIMYELEDNSKE